MRLPLGSFHRSGKATASGFLLVDKPKGMRSRQVVDIVRKLEDAGYVSCDKTFEGRTPRTDYRLTASGRRALEKYLNHLDAIIRATRSS